MRRTTGLLVPLLMMALVGTLAYEFQVVLPLLARVSLHGGATTYGFLTSAMGAGAVAGGLLGHQIGGGTGRTLATVGGAAAGGYAGNQVQKNMQEKDTVSRTETRCKTVYESHTKTIGYNVRYRLGKEESLVRMDHPPGSRIPVKDGKLQLDASATP